MRTDSRPVRTTLLDQTVEILRAGLAEGRWKTRLPGSAKLASELGVSTRTVQGAQKRLLAEGLLTSVGERRALMVNVVRIAEVGIKKKTTRAKARIAVLNPLPPDAMGDGTQVFLIALLKELSLDGYTTDCVHIPNGKAGGRIRRLATLVRETKADLWLVNLGDAEVLQWFARSGLMVLAMGGAFRDIAIPAFSATWSRAIPDATARLVALGHTRIVMIAPEAWREKNPNHSGTLAFRKSMAAAGITVGNYHLPQWLETPEGLVELLDGLFRITPPTAILCMDNNSPHGVLNWLARRGLNIPGDISIITRAQGVQANWASPGVRLAYFDSNEASDIRAIRRWTSDALAGRARNERIEVHLHFVPGESLAPAKR